MTPRADGGAPLQPGVNVDRVDVEAGLRMLVQLGWPESEQRTHMVITYALRRWARGEEEAADRGATEPTFYGIDLTSWRAVLAVAITSADAAAEAGA